MNRTLAIVLVLICAGVVLRRGGGEGPFFPAATEKVALISRGAEIDVNRYLADDGYTLLEFGADW